MALGHITDLAARAAVRMLWQYKSLTKFNADLAVLVAEAQELEDAFWAFFGELDIDTADGVWLDRLAGLIGESREGDVDTRYRNMAKARILANKATGRSDELLAIAAQAFADLGSLTVALVDWYPAAQALTIAAPPIGGDDPYANPQPPKKLARLLGAARAVSVQLMLLYQPDVDSTIFVYGDATGAITPTGKGFDSASAPNDPTAGKLAGALNT